MKSTQKFFNTEVKGLLNQNPNAQKFLEAFYAADYKVSAANLIQMIKTLDSDMYMRQNRELFHKMILDKMIKQYLQPITRISINKMSHTLNLPTEMLIEFLKELIRNKDISFLIDPVDMVLVAKKEKKKTKEDVMDQALKLTTNYVLEKTLAILRYNLGNRRKFTVENASDAGQATFKNSK